MWSQLSIYALAAAICPTLAIPPESFGFPSAPNDTMLEVVFPQSNGTSTMVREGELFGTGVTSRMPTLAVDTTMYRSLATYRGSYLVIMVDPDVSTPQNPNRRFLLHWMQPNMRVGSNNAGVQTGGQQLINTSAPAVPFAMPAPPATSDPHRYILYAFMQPSNFTVPTAFQGFNAMNRSSFNLTQFVSAAGLSQPAAAQYFFVSRKNGTPMNFTAMPGGMFPGGNGAAVTDGPGPSASSTGGASMTGSAGSMSSSAGAAPALEAGKGVTPVVAALGMLFLWGM